MANARSASILTSSRVLKPYLRTSVQRATHDVVLRPTSEPPPCSRELWLWAMHYALLCMLHVAWPPHLASRPFFGRSRQIGRRGSKA
eukprot:scaffold324145_cov53-Tisochrysis_lutea.AAC.1